MTQNRITRREFLRRGLLGLSVVAGWRPANRWGQTTGKAIGGHGEEDTGDLTLYHPPASTSDLQAVPSAAVRLALSEHEHATVAAIAAIIVPTDDDPGATEADVAGYVDRKVSQDAVERQRYVEGVRWIDGASGKLFGSGKRFVDLSLAQQTAVLQAAEETLNMRLRPVTTLWARAWRKVQKTYDDLFGLGAGASFFRFVREDTLAGFYTNPVSWSMLAYAGPPQPRGYPHYEDCPVQARR
jgi:hypothetical protein